MEPNGTLEPTLNGRFSLYQTPEGGIHIAWMADDDPETHHLEVPGFLASLARRAAEGKLTPAQMLKEVMSNAQAGDLST